MQRHKAEPTALYVNLIRYTLFVWYNMDFGVTTAGMRLMTKPASTEAIPARLAISTTLLYVYDVYGGLSG